MIAPLPPSTRLTRVAFALALVQCVLAPIPHVTALENITAYLLLGCVVVLAYRQRSFPLREPLVVALGALSLYLIAVSAVGPYPLESLNAWRKDYMPALVLFIALLMTTTSRSQVQAVLVATVAGSAIRLAIIALELWVLHRPLYGDRPGFIDAYTQQLIPSAFYGGFSLIASIYSPLSVAVLLRKDLSLPHRLWIGLSALGAAFLVIDYGSRTSLVTLCAGFFVICVAHFTRRTILAAVATTFLLSGYIYWYKPEAATRYGSLFSEQTYANGIPGKGITIGDRLRIWKGMLEIADQRPLIGYGYGWKKLSLIVRDGGFLDRWRSAPQPDEFTVSYFSRGYGGINPHNLALHLYFEGGFVGIGFFLLLLIVAANSTWRLMRSKDVELRQIGLLAGTFFASWLVANLGNSIWAGEKLPFIVMALLVLAVRIKQEDTAHDPVSLTRPAPSGTA